MRGHPDHANDELNYKQLEGLEKDLHVTMLSKCGNSLLMDVPRRSQLVHVFNSFYGVVRET